MVSNSRPGSERSRRTLPCWAERTTRSACSRQRDSRLQRFRVASRQAEQPIQERSSVWHRHRRWKDPDRPPLLSVRADLVPDALDQLLRELRIDADHLGDVVSAKAPEHVGLPEIAAGWKVAERAVDGAV